MSEYYEILGIARDATSEAVRFAFRARASANHPDKGGSAEKMAEINRAYECLSDPVRRAAYDETGRDPGAMPIDAEVRGLLLAAFADALNKEVPDIVAFAREFVRHHIGALQSQAAIGRSRAAKLEGKRGKVRARSGANLFEMIVDNQLAEVRKVQAQIEHQTQVHELALETLKNYECDVDGTPFFRITMTTTL